MILFSQSKETNIESGGNRYEWSSIVYFRSTGPGSFWRGQCWNTDSETLQMRERVYKEWMSLHGNGLNGLLNIRVALISTLIIATGLELIWKHKKFRMMMKFWMR